MTYEEALGYLDGLLLGRMPGPQPYNPVKLERMRYLCDLLGHPERGFRTVLVAGTKGKGSTAAMIAAMAADAGLQVGLYTKPHLVDFRERMRVNGELISTGEVATLMLEVRDAIARGHGGPAWPPTYFEASAALAFLHFARRRVDLAVVEVGIGGRLDATNVVEPCVSVITTIHYDHTDLFGHNLRQIAAEDAGIIRPGSVTVTVPQPPAALEVLEQAAASCGATLIRVGREVRYRTQRASREGLCLSVYGHTRQYRDLKVALIGRHQSLNAAAAVAAIEALRTTGFSIPDAAVRSGLASLRWPARIEVIGASPTLVLDVAHNAVSFRALRAALDEIFPGERVVLVIGLLGSKDLDGIARIIGPRAAVVIATRAHDERALDAADVAAVFRPLVAEVHTVDDPAEAVTLALAVSGPQDLICVTGSFHVAGPVMEHFARAPVRRQPGTAPEPAGSVAGGAVGPRGVRMGEIGRLP